MTQRAIVKMSSSVPARARPASPVVSNKYRATLMAAKESIELATNESIQCFVFNDEKETHVF